MGAEAQEMIHFGILFEGAEKAAEQMSALATGAKQTQKAVDGLGPSTAGAKRAVDDLGGSLGNTRAKADSAVAGLSGMQQAGQRTATVIGSLGGVVGQLSPELGALTSGIGRAGAAFGGFATLAGGPVALAIGVASLALTGLGAIMRSNRDDAIELADALEKRTVDAAKKLADVRAAIAGGLAKDNPFAAVDERQRVTGQALTDLDRLGTGTAEDKTRARAGFEAAKADAKYARETAIAEAADAAHQKEFDAALTGTKYEGGTGAQSGGSKEQTGLQKFKADKSLDDSFTKPSTGDTSGTGFEFAGAESFDKMIADKAAAGQAMLDSEATYQDEMTALRKRAHADEMAMKAEAHLATGQGNALALAGMQMLGGAAASVFQKIAAGQKVSGKAILAGIGNELIGKGTMWMFEGAAKGLISLGTDPTAGPLVATGAAAVAAGMGMGAAGASGGGSAGGGGGGGGGRASSRDMQFRPSSPDAIPAGSTNAGLNGRPIIVNMPTVIAANAEDGRRVKQALEEADRHGG